MYNIHIITFVEQGFYFLIEKKNKPANLAVISNRIQYYIEFLLLC